MSKRRYGFSILLLGGLLLLGACSTRVPKAGLNAFDNCDYEKAKAVFQEKTKNESKDYVLYNMALLSSAIAGGDYETAKKAGLNAQRVVWSDVGKGRGQASLVSAEAIKVFKGEPFEKAMIGIYLGIVFFNEGQMDNARAAFSKAVLGIKQKEKAEFREGFALAYFLLAKTYWALGEKDNARISLEKAQKVYPNHPALKMSSISGDNSVFLFEIGKAPKKTRTGPGASLVEWKRRKYPEQSAHLTLDKDSPTTAVEVADLTVEARTKGHTGKDTVQATKGVAREAATATAVIAAGEAAKGNETAGWVALGAGLFAIANQSQADTRQWELLPDRILLATGDIHLGENRFGVTFLNSSRSAISSLNQTWSYFASPEDVKKGKIFLFRSDPCRQSGIFNFSKKVSSTSDENMM